MTVRETIQERHTTHGDYVKRCRISQNLKGDMAESGGWEDLNDGQREALEMIAVKISRILAGDPDCADHWLDIAGYATLAADRPPS